MRAAARLLSGLAAFAGTAAMAAAAIAQPGPPPTSPDPQPVPPVYSAQDPRGIDLASGTFNYATSEVVIGQPGSGGLAYGRVYVGAPSGWRDTLLGTINASGSTYTVSIGAESETFTRSGTTFTPTSNNGSRLAYGSGGYYDFTTSQGSTVRFVGIGSEDVTPYQANVALLTSYATPTGDRVDYHYVTALDTGLGVLGWRLQSVTTNRGYQIHYRYVSNDFTNHRDQWLTVANVLGLNNAVDACDPQASACTSLTRTWPSVTYALTSGGQETVTDELARTTTYTYGSSGIAGISPPGAASDEVVLSYDTDNRVDTATDATGTWTYAYNTGAGTLITTVSGPAGQALTPSRTHRPGG